jgi:hypothetical protein
VTCCAVVRRCVCVPCAQLWSLADIDKDGHLDSDEFAVIVYLIDAIKQKHIDGVPPELPSSLVPPSKRQHLAA